MILNCVEATFATCWPCLTEAGYSWPFYSRWPSTDLTVLTIGKTHTISFSSCANGKKPHVVSRLTDGRSAPGRRYRTEDCRSCGGSPKRLTSSSVLPYLPSRFGKRLLLLATTVQQIYSQWQVTVWCSTRISSNSIVGQFRSIDVAAYTAQVCFEA